MRKEFEGKESKFKAPVTQKGKEKIYIILDRNEAVYVGHTSQAIGSRLGGAIKATGENSGYKGYGWKHLNEVTLMVFMLDEADKKFAEAIEAELTFELRKKTGKWPKYQTGIHFNNGNRDTVCSITKKILKLINS